MATRSRDTAPTGKEKRGTSPIHHQRTTTNTSKTTSPVRKQTDPTLTRSCLNKNVPSYLKPTIAQAQKSAPSSDLHNIHSTKTSNLARRRSFDNKPPLPSSSPKTRISPSPKERISRSSSSLSTKTSTSHKPLLDRLSKATTSKDATGKQCGAGLNSRPVTKKKTTTTTTRKHDRASGSTTKAPVTTNSPDIVLDVISLGEQSEPEDHQELTIHETEKETIISDNEMIADSDAGENENDSATEDHIEELINENVNSAELEDTKAAAESSTLVENPEIKTEEPEEINNEPNSPEKEKDETIINASSEENQESKEEDQGTNQAKEAPMIEDTEAVPQEQQLSLSPKEVGVSVEESTKEEPEKNTIAASSKSRHQLAQGKHNESAVSNNVIEETASKLREQRKNKVKALAGAFETVISLQEHK
ncbi:suppressor protein SRP40 [Capsicum galapagoense]